MSIWQSGHVYTVGQTCLSLSAPADLYICVTGGTSTITGTGPSGTGSGIIDGTVIWNYISPTQVPIWDVIGTNAVESTASQKTDGINADVFDGDLYKNLNWQLKLIGDWFTFINAGVSGSFTADGKTITVTKGIITSIVTTPP